jgi:hypothetical protein
VNDRYEKSPRTKVKLFVLVALAATALVALAWVNQQNVRDVEPGRPPLTQSGF